MTHSDSFWGKNILSKKSGQASKRSDHWLDGRPVKVLLEYQIALFHAVFSSSKFTRLAPAGKLGRAWRDC